MDFCSRFVHDHCYSRDYIKVTDHSYAKSGTSFHPYIDYRSSNLILHPRKFNIVSAVLNVIHAAKPSAVCLSCGKVLYTNQIYWLKEYPKHLWHAEKLIPEGSPVKIQKKEVSGKESFSCCLECFTKIGKKEQIHLFDDFGDIPECVKLLNSYHEYRKLAIGSLFCSTFKPPGYTYLHNVGDIWFNKDPRIYRGMVGIMYEGQNKELRTTNKDVKKTLIWFRKHNFLYKDFFSNLETIVGHFDPTDSTSRFAALPTFTKDLKIAKGGQLPVKEIEKQEGLLFPADKFAVPNVPVNIKNVQIGEEVLRDTGEKVGMAQELSYSDENLEAKLFPHLFPYGKGSWYSKKNALTIGKYHKMRLLHVDRRWANDRFYPFFTFDRNIKQRLFYAKNAMATNKNRKTPLQSENIDEDNYYKYGKIVPVTVPGSKAFWTKKWLDLVAIVSEKGPADIFFTLTANDSWKELKEILSQYGNPASIMHPVEPTEYFFQRFSAIKPLIFGNACNEGVFGKVNNFWYRVEAQNRGALHIHGMLWLENEVPTDAVIAEMPRGDASEIEGLRELVKKFQIHSCRPNRCYRSSKGTTTTKCKYGFPYCFRKEDGYDETGVRYEYKRTEREDFQVVPYNPYLLIAWDGHVNVQKVTRSGLERYLVKYISKVEPTFGLQVEYKNDVMKYLESRIIGAPEAVAMQLSHKIVDSNMQVIFIDTNYNEERFRVLKPKHKLDEEDDTDDIFQPGLRENYLARPKLALFETVTLPEYLTSYIVFTGEKGKVPKYAGNNVWMDQNKNQVIKRQKVLVPRHHFLTPLDGEKFYYQQLLLKTPFYDENELISTDNGTKTYKEECYIRGIFESQDEIDVAFKEMKSRQFDPNGISRMARKMLFEQLADKKTLAKKIAEMELGEPVPFDTEIDSDNIPVVELQQDPINEEMSSDVHRILSVTRCKILAEKQDLESRISQLTDDQKKTLDYVCENLDSQILAFVTGPGGTGKSFLLHSIMLKLETSALIVEVLATSGNAALLIGGRTIHSFFKIGIDLNINISYEDQTWHSISSTQALIIDEVSMMSGELLEKIDSVCRLTAQGNLKNKPFGGKHLILFGDLFQLPAVINDINTMQIYESVMFPLFKPFILNQNCRQRNDMVFAEMLNRIREGTFNESDIDILKSRICQTGHQSENCRQLINSTGSMAICSKHQQRCEINDNIQKYTLSDQPLYSFHAKDYDSAGSPLSIADSEFLNSVKGVMPVRLDVRKNARIMITRNLDIQGGIVNGTCGILRSVHPKVLMIEHQVTHEIIPVTKVKQRIALKGSNTVVYRMQFPIILSWACTVHRVQGTTLEQAIINLDKTFFAPGQAYVALSRVKNLESLHLMSFDPVSIIVNPHVVDIMKYAKSTGHLKSISVNKSNGVNSVFKFVSNKGCENSRMEIDDIETSEKELNRKTNMEVDDDDNVSSDEHHIKDIDRIHHASKIVWQKHLPLNLFLVKDRFSDILTIIEKLSPTLEEIRSTVKNGFCVFNCANHLIDSICLTKLHPSFRHHYIPVRTSPDGNCLWNMISINLIGNESLTTCLRLLTVQVLANHKDFFYHLIKLDLFHRQLPNEEVNVQSFYREVLEIARKWRSWGGEFHLLALSIALQRDIYIYTTFQHGNKYIIQESVNDTALKTLFDHGDVKTKGHLLYRSPIYFQTPDYNSMSPVCGFFFSQHYTAILRKTNEVLIFSPKSELFKPLFPAVL